MELLRKAAGNLLEKEESSRGEYSPVKSSRRFQQGSRVTDSTVTAEEEAESWKRLQGLRIDNLRTRNICSGVSEDLKEDGFEDGSEVSEDLENKLPRRRRSPPDEEGAPEVEEELRHTKSWSKTTCS